MERVIIHQKNWIINGYLCPHCLAQFVPVMKIIQHVLRRHGVAGWEVEGRIGLRDERQNGKTFQKRRVYELGKGPYKGNVEVLGVEVLACDTGLWLLHSQQFL